MNGGKNRNVTKKRRAVLAEAVVDATEEVTADGMIDADQMSISMQMKLCMAEVQCVEAPLGARTTTLGVVVREEDTGRGRSELNTSTWAEPRRELDVDNNQRFTMLR